jgi:hypothetical protein
LIGLHLLLTTFNYRSKHTTHLTAITHHPKVICEFLEVSLEKGLVLSKRRIQSTVLPPKEVQLSTIDLYFQYSHNQPYCFFHEESFRHQFSNELLPEYLILAVLSLATRYSPDITDADKAKQTSNYAAKAWKDIMSRCFDSEEGPDHRLVQAATLLALHDFTGV